MKAIDRIVRAKELTAVLGVSKSTLWRWEQSEILPPRKKIGNGIAVGWLLSDIEKFLQSRPNAGKKVEERKK